MNIKPRPITAKFEIALATRNINGASTPTINLRELHFKLKNGDEFAHWIKDRIDQYGFIENKDYTIVFGNLPKNPKGGRSKIEYYGTLTMAKELAMVEKNSIGKAARQYFIQQEEELQKLKQQPQQPFMPRGYPQMLEAARNDWKQVRKELIDLLGTHLQVYDRKRKSQFTDKMYLDLIEATARQLREHFQLSRSNQLTRDYLHQLVQECICEIEIRMSDSLLSGSVTTWEVFKEEFITVTNQTRYMKELQNGRIPLPHYAFPTVHFFPNTLH